MAFSKNSKNEFVLTVGVLTTPDPSAKQVTCLAEYVTVLNQISLQCMSRHQSVTTILMNLITTETINSKMLRMDCETFKSIFKCFKTEKKSPNPNESNITNYICMHTDTFNTTYTLSKHHQKKSRRHAGTTSCVDTVLW